MSAFLSIVALVLEAVFGVFTAYAAYSLFTGTPPSVAKVREALHYPSWFWLLAKIAATTGAVGLLVGLGFAVMGFAVIGAAAALWMVAYFVVATLAHVIRKDMANLSMPISFLVIAVALVALRWGGVTQLLAVVHL